MVVPYSNIFQIGSRGSSSACVLRVLNLVHSIDPPNGTMCVYYPVLKFSTQTHVLNLVPLALEVHMYTPVSLESLRFLGMLLGSAQSVEYVCFLSPDPANEPAQLARLAAVFNP